VGNGEIKRILERINANFPSGEMSIITGAVGAGKSTLLNTLAGLTRPTSGEVIVNGQAISRWAGAHKDKWRRLAGIVFQHYHLLQDLTVLENVMLPLIPLGYTLGKCRCQSLEALEKVGLLHHAGSRANLLSGGERQKTAIARAIVSQPGFLFADEPTAHLDAENSRQIMDLLYHHVCLNSVVIVATHELTMDTLPGKPTGYRLEDGALNPLSL